MLLKKYWVTQVGSSSAKVFSTESHCWAAGACNREEHKRSCNQADKGVHRLQQVSITISSTILTWATQREVLGPGSGHDGRPSALCGMSTSACADVVGVAAVEWQSSSSTVEVTASGAARFLLVHEVLTLGARKPVLTRWGSPEGPVLSERMDRNPLGFLPGFRK